MYDDYYWVSTYEMHKTHATIIRLVHLNIVGVSTWNYIVMNTHEMGILNAA